MKIIERLSWILGFPAGYSLFQQLVGGNSSWQTVLHEYVRPLPGEKILDLGCGPGAILNFLPAVNYTGFDIDEEYIRSAKERFGTKGRFLCGNPGLAEIESERETFDVVMSIGVLHHVDDADAAKLLALACSALRPGGRLITYDGCYTPNQSRIAKWLLSRDRGKFVRAPEEYIRLASVHFSKVEPSIRHDLLRVPYTHLIMRCSDGASV
jgi:2-polyprenyl-3-methyl-5-hydroxy-6-metoxy-1,4-benzoquinol methylase